MTTPAPTTGSARRAVDHAVRTAGSPGLPFPDYLEIALYGDHVGYYTKPRANHGPTGRRGDFFTSVSVGPCFGFLLARYLLDTWHRTGRPTPFALVEAGANDARLTRDILDALADLDPPCFDAVRPVILERSAAGRAAAASVLPGAVCTPSIAGAAPLPHTGLVVANELFDALPFHLVRFSRGRWHERFVTHAPDGSLTLVDAPPSNPGVAARCSALGNAFPDGYTTEINLAAPAWLAATTTALGHGACLAIDYGFPADELYHPSRSSGTLRTYSRHNAGDDPLAAPGDLDITCHVDFTSLADAARHAGWHPHPLVDQNHFLTRLATPWLKSLENDPAALATSRPLLRQFQTLTHPSSMGRSFKVLELTRASPPAAQPPR